MEVRRRRRAIATLRIGHQIFATIIIKYALCNLKKVVHQSIELTRLFEITQTRRCTYYLELVSRAS